MIRASFSQERMTPYPVRGRLYIPEETKVISVIEEEEVKKRLPACNAYPHHDLDARLRK